MGLIAGNGRATGSGYECPMQTCRVHFGLLADLVAFTDLRRPLRPQCIYGPSQTFANLNAFAFALGAMLGGALMFTATGFAGIPVHSIDVAVKIATAAQTFAPTSVVLRSLQLEERMAVLAAAISIDYDYFSLTAAVLLSLGQRVLFAVALP
eukprot:497912-Pelagomonas_calceolata.AAC.2